MMTQTEEIYNRIKEKVLSENPDYIEVTREMVKDEILDSYSHLTIVEAAALLESVNLSHLEAYIADAQREEQSYLNNPLAHVGMSWRDFV